MASTTVPRPVWLGSVVAYSAGDPMNTTLYTALDLTDPSDQIQIVTVGANVWTVTAGPGLPINPTDDFFVDPFVDLF